MKVNIHMIVKLYILLGQIPANSQTTDITMMVLMMLPNIPITNHHDVIMTVFLRMITIPQMGFGRLLWTDTS